MGSGAPLLLVTKLHPPSVPDQAVARERLFARLEEGRGRKLTLVACPAGFGKSTLLAAWREWDPRPIAWVSLDEGDNDEVVLWSHVVGALARTCPELDEEALLTTVAAAPVTEIALPRLVNELADQPECALVLDDFHRLTSASSRESVAWLLERLPASVQLVLATRTDPSLPLGTLRARGQLLELRADELRFTASETEEFLNGRLELGLEPADVELLATRTEGWPAGVYLAALSLAGKPDKHALVAAFDGTSAHVVDFLAGEVLASFEPELQAFMLRTAVLERLCAPLCDAVLQRGDAAAALDTLARTNLFLIPLDDRRTWFRFHHLFAQILRVELERRHPATAAELHRRAYEWHLADGTTDEAIHHAVAAEAFPEAGDLIAETWVHYANAGRTSSVADWLERFPADLLAADARLLTVKAWVSALLAREEDMHAAVAQARALGGLEEAPSPDGFVSLDSSLSVLRATFAWGDVGAVLEHGLRSAEIEGPDSPWRPVITWSVGWAHYCNGDLDEAERWFEETVERTPATDQWIVGIASIADLSLIAGIRGRREEQARLSQQAIDVAREHGLLDSVEEGEVHAAHGMVLIAEGRLAEALPELERGAFLRRLWGQPLDLVDGLLWLAAALAALGDRERAQATLDEAGTILARCPSPGALPRRLAAARREIARCEELSDRERDIVRLLAGDLTEREIARELYLSFNTVHTHVKSIYRKLGVSSRAEAVARSPR